MNLRRLLPTTPKPAMPIRSLVIRFLPPGVSFRDAEAAGEQKHQKSLQIQFSPHRRAICRDRRRVCQRPGIWRDRWLQPARGRVNCSGHIFRNKRIMAHHRFRARKVFRRVYADRFCLGLYHLNPMPVFNKPEQVDGFDPLQWC